MGPINLPCRRGLHGSHLRQHLQPCWFHCGVGLLLCLRSGRRGYFVRNCPIRNSSNTGSIAGIIRAGGNTGAVCFGLGFRQMKYKSAFVPMGSTIIVSSVLSVFVLIPGHGGIIWARMILPSRTSRSPEAPSRKTLMLRS